MIFAHLCFSVCSQLLSRCADRCDLFLCLFALFPAQHEDGVTSCAVSPDGLKIAVGTLNGSLGALDVSTHSYHSLLRSHHRDIIAVACRPNNTESNVAAVAPPRWPEPISRLSSISSGASTYDGMLAVLGCG